ncbi:hypothetical protein NJL88_29090 [Streptomyces sp. DK15]|uniref:hypothetical protein n=1 Tax=Streptomyces sp. DK15 TaxID=2957499 RepID=UPI0029AA344F|nr:hypothetical protein [Streptomyces sp. DK15]MDX2394047.1 hypothetical protein [Streptomyces sp. DK15]
MMKARVWMAAGIASGVFLAGGGWYALASAESTSHAVCDVDLSKDAVVADEFERLAVVEAVRTTRSWEESGSAYRSSEVRLLRALQGTVPESFTVTQGVTPKGDPVHDDPVHVVLEPGHQYVVGLTDMDDNDPRPWAGYSALAKGGVEGEVARWRDARSAVAPPAKPCNDVVVE